jgi:transcriptional regulator with XRE-family HTH domain
MPESHKLPLSTTTIKPCRVTGVQQRAQTPANQRIGENLRTFRTKKGMSQTDLAKEMTARGWPWHQQTVALTESGKRPIRADELEVISEIFDTMIGMLMWEGAEINESHFVYGAGIRVKQSWLAVADAVAKLMLARSTAGRVISKHRHSKYERTQEAILDVKGRLREFPLEAAIREGIHLYENRNSLLEAGALLGSYPETLG